MKPNKKPLRRGAGGQWGWLRFFNEIREMLLDAIGIKVLLGPLKGLLITQGDQFFPAARSAIGGVICKPRHSAALAVKEKVAGSWTFVERCRPVGEINSL